MRAEFEVDEVECVPNGILVRGAVNEGDLRLGEVFLWVTSNRSTRETERHTDKNIQLKIESIITYSQNVDELYSGMTGEISLSGVGVEKVTKKSWLLM